jgi:hypothetical protein
MRPTMIRSRFLRAAALAAAVAALDVSSVGAQSVLPEPGDTTRVRSARRHAGWHEGIVVRADAESVVVARSDTRDTASYAVRSLRDWEVARGSKNRLLTGFLVGLGTGATLGALAVPAFYDGIAASYGPEDVAIGAGVGGAIGGAIGALIGVLVRTERWEPVVRPGAGVTAGVVIAF